jgi:hypothetical protein
MIMGLFVATKAFFKLLFNRELSHSFQAWMDEGGTPRLAVENQLIATTGTRSAPVVEPAKPVQPSKPSRSEAITLLSALQREARLIDIIQEPLDSFSDSQIGAAARDVLKNSGGVIERMFGLVPAVDVKDGEQISTPATLDPSLYRLTGNVSGAPPFRGTVAHHGWRATRCDVPTWNGSAESVLILAPIEIEVE